MTVLLVLALVGVGFVLTVRRSEKPSELYFGCWDSNPAVRAANVAAKTADLKEGWALVWPKGLGRWESALARPWSSESLTAITPPEPEGRLIREHQMRPPIWKKHGT